MTTTPDVFVLGSSGYGTRFAAVNGLGAVFAHHMSPELAVEALREYRSTFRPGYVGQPWSAVSVIVHATDDPDEAEAAIASWALLIGRLRAGDRGPRPTFDQIREYARSSEFPRARQCAGSGVRRPGGGRGRASE